MKPASLSDEKDIEDYIYHGVLKFESDKLCAETRRNKYSIFSPIGVCRLENKRHPNNPAFESRLVTYNYQFTFRMCSRKNVWIVVLEMSQSQDLKKHLQAKSKLQIFNNKTICLR